MTHMPRLPLSWRFPCLLAWSLLGALGTAQQPSPSDDLCAWRRHGECWILTDAAGAALPASTSVADFPLLLRLRQGVFDFAAAQPHGEDLRVTDVAWGNGGRLECDIVRATQSPPSDLLANGGFEQGVGGMPTGWTTGAWQPGAVFAWDASTAFAGARSVRIDAPVANDAHWSQTVTGLAPGAAYRLTGWLRGEAISDAPGAIGGNLCVLGGFSFAGGHVGTFDWTEAALVFVAPTAEVAVAARLGFYGSTASGTLWCDGMRLEALRSAFP